jgi:hypothetical protein
MAFTRMSKVGTCCGAWYAHVQKIEVKRFCCLFRGYFQCTVPLSTLFVESGS